MKRILIAVVVCLALGLTGWAQQNPSDAPATQADVEKYLDVIHSHEMIKQMTEAMSEPMHKMMHEQYMKNKDKLPPDFEQRMNKITDEMMRDMPFDDMMQAMVPVYQKHFTKGEIDALTAFYSTPSGQKILREMPAVMADAMSIMMPTIQKHVEKITLHMQDEMTAMLKESDKHETTAPEKRN